MKKKVLENLKSKAAKDLRKRFLTMKPAKTVTYGGHKVELFTKSQITLLFDKMELSMENYQVEEDAPRVPKPKKGRRQESDEPEPLQY